MITALEKAFHALLLGFIFMLMMSLLNAQIPPEPSELVIEMDGYVTLLRNTALVYGVLALILLLSGLLSFWWKDAEFLKWLQRNPTKISFSFNLASFAVISYFISWFWAVPC
jgi:hypothetical protein